MAPPKPDAFTRFTSTSPHANSKPPPSTFASSSPSSSTPPFASRQPAAPSPSPKPLPTQTTQSKYPPGPPNETPREKVARLRAAYRLAKSRAALSPLDRAILTGRRVADTAHRIVAYGLIGFSGKPYAPLFNTPNANFPLLTTNIVIHLGIASVVAIYAMIDLIRHNRRQKRAWIDRELQRLHDAKVAFVQDTATEEQLHLLQQERAGDEMVEKAKREKERRKRESWWGRGKALVGLGWKGDDKNLSTTQAEEVEVSPEERFLNEGRWLVGAEKSITQTLRGLWESNRRRAGEEKMDHMPGQHGGPLDVSAKNVTETVKGKTATRSGWLDLGKGNGEG